MKTWLELYRQLDEDRYFHRVALNPLAQFGSEDQPLLGARYLPEVLVGENSYEETQVRYRSMPALDGTRYSPAQLQSNGALVGSFKVDLGNTDTASQFTGQDHDGVIKLLMRDGEEEAIAQLIRWSDSTLVRPHTIKNELQRWEAIIQGQVTRKGSNGYSEVVNYHKPVGHRPEVSGGTAGTPEGWYSNTYDPYDDIFAGKEKLEDLGYMVTDMILTPKLFSVMRKNAEVAKRNSSVVVNASGQITSLSSQISMAELNQINSDNGLPPFTSYNGGYESATGFKRFLDAPDGDRDYLIMLGRSQRQWDMKTDYASRVEGIDTSSFSDQAIVLSNTLGYYGVGRNVGQSSSGRTVLTEPQNRKPQGLYGEAYQAGLPVITEPDAIFVIQVLRPTA